MRVLAALGGPILAVLAVTLRRQLSARQALLAVLAGPVLGVATGLVAWWPSMGRAAATPGFPALEHLFHPFFLAAYVHLAVCVLLVPIGAARGVRFAGRRLVTMLLAGGATVALLSASSLMPSRSLAHFVELLAISGSFAALQAGYCVPLGVPRTTPTRTE